MIRRATRLGVLAAGTAAALSGCGFNGVSSLPLPGGPGLGGHPITVRIEFANVLDLVPQSVVKVNDVSVGKVSKVQLAGGDGGWHALVTVRIRRDADLPDNAVASVDQTSLLGEKFISLSPPPNEQPSANRLSTGDLIPLARTSRGTEVEEVLSAMSLLLNGGGIEQVSTITHELTAAMNGRESTIKSVLGRVDTFVGTLDRNRASITRALDSIDRLSAKLSDERATIRDTIDKTGPALTVLNQNRADLTKMLTALDKLSRTTTNVINRSRDDLLANLKDLDVTVRNLNKAGDKLPKNLEALINFPFPTTFGNVVKGDYGNVKLTVDLDFDSISQNLLGGTDLDPALGGKQMASQLKVPNVALPQSPVGALPDAPATGQGAAPTPSATPTTSPSPTGKTGKPRAAGRGDVGSLMMGGLS
ncbi:MCE family protein [Actinomadura rayongensis]|uniref:MCE family protein n=1 Tax=Actinomadura rayongensis TaxID=1429076 RepID=A0A6I4W656_9ACTN|nr:MCE family protein [Actinomadura rayongensis]